ncbi:TPA: MATE family efflux transporter [Candidatus Woesearchaeota archaeon]|nr:MATE family efflux transporter [Candidatus Woesearchaeota archaeon]
MKLLKAAFGGRPAKKNRVNEFAKDPKKALIKLSIPILVGMVVQALYNIVDTAFVGRLGSDSIAALTFAFPLFFILISLNMGIATGMTSRISRQLGAKQKKGAENTAMHGLLFTLLVAAVVIVLGLVFLDQVFLLFGASNSVLELATGYMRIILYGAFFMFTSFALNQMLTAQGDTKTPMMIQVIALVCNIILDPIFIYVLGYGVRGAAIATVISFFISMVLALVFVSRRSYLHIHIKNFSFGWSILKDIIRVGFPASLMMLLMSFYAMFINRLMASFGTDYVAAFGLDWRLNSLANMPMVAISISTMTLVGMFYGAKRYDLLKKTVGYSLKTAFIWGASMAMIFAAVPQIWLRIFTADPELIALAAKYVRVEVWMFPFMGTGLIIARAIQAIGKGMPGLVIMLVRTLLVAVPLAYLFVFVFGYGYLSVAVAMVASGVVSAGLALIWWRYCLRKCNGTA